MDVKIEESWKAVLREEFDKEYFSRIAAFLHQEKREGKTIYPPGPLIFNAFRLTPFDQVKVVILGQDPYHGPGQAHGLSFSVQDGVALPPSLQNIYKEISNDIGTPAPASGNLERWARQGVFLLNSVLTVRAGAPMADLHRCRHQDPFRQKGRTCIHAVGQLCQKQETPYRQFKTSGAGSGPSITPGPGSLLRMPAFLQSQRISDIAGENPDCMVSGTLPHRITARRVYGTGPRR